MCFDVPFNFSFDSHSGVWSHMIIISIIEIHLLLLLLLLEVCTQHAAHPYARRLHKYLNMIECVGEWTTSLNDDKINTKKIDESCWTLRSRSWACGRPNQNRKETHICFTFYPTSFLRMWFLHSRSIPHFSMFHFNRACLKPWNQINHH